MRLSNRIAIALAVTLVSTAATAGAAPVGDQALNALIAEGSRLWECSSEYSTIGKAKKTASIDPGVALRRLAADVSAVGRYDEFSYLIEFVERETKAGRLKVVSIDDIPPLPGFYAGRQDGTRRVIAISAAELSGMSPDDVLYRSSFLRAAAALYYSDASPSVPGTYLGRNAAAELSALMSGLYVESLYLLEVMKLAEPEGAAPDYIDALLSSASQDNLRGAADLLFRVDLDLAYEAVRMARNAPSVEALVEYIEGVARSASALAASSLVAALKSQPNQVELDAGSTARAMLIALPWTARTVMGGPAGKDPAVASAVSGLVEALTSLSSSYAHLDPLAMAATRERLNELRFRLPDPGAPRPEGAPRLEGAFTIYDDPPGAPGPFPGSSSEAWYRFCHQDNPYERSGEVPVGRDEALRGSAFRFSYGPDGEVVAVEHFTYGRLRSADELQWAARIRTERDEIGEWSVWENAYGAPFYNESGYAYSRRADGPDGYALSFFAPDGRRVPDCTGSWIVAFKRLADGYDLEYRSAGGALRSGPFGYAVDSRRTVVGGRTERAHFDEKGRPARSLALGYHGSSMDKRRTDDGYVVELSFRDAAGAKAAVLGGYTDERITIGEAGRLYEFLDADGAAVDGGQGWATERITWRDGLAESLRYYSSDGRPAVSVDGFHEVRYRLDERGDIVEAAFFGPGGEAVSCADGFHRRSHEYDERGGLLAVSFYDEGGGPAADVTGAARIRWSIGPDGASDGVTVWDVHGSLLAGEPSRAL